MKQNIVAIIAASSLVLSTGEGQAMSLTSLAPEALASGRETLVTLTGSGLTTVDHLLLSLSLGEVNTDIGQAVALGTVYGVSAVGNTAYIAGGGDGLQIVETTDLVNPTLTASWDTPGYALGVNVVGNLAYLADGDDGLQIIDISKPSAPTFKGQFDTPGYALGVCVVGNLAYVADLSSLQIIDVSDPATPRLKGALAMDGPVGRVSVAEDKAYVASGKTTIATVDVSEPSTPVLSTPIDAFGHAYGVTISNTTLYVTDGASGVRRIDVSSPTSPKLMSGGIDTPGKACDVSLADNRLYIADLSSLQITDGSGTPLGTLPKPKSFKAAAVDLPAFVQDEGGQLTIPAPLALSPKAQAEDTLTATIPALPAGSYELSVVASNGATETLGNALALSPTVLTPDPGWNLLGAGLDMTVDQLFSDANHYASVWKWATTSGQGKNWAVYLPDAKDSAGAPDDGASYAQSKGFTLLTTIEAGEGFWVNCKDKPPVEALPGALASGGLTLMTGWNLVALKAGGAIPVADLIKGKESSVVSLWKWAASVPGGNKTWQVSLPEGKTVLGQPDGGASYAQSKGFGSLNLLSAGEGFWINVTSAELTLP